ncbi:MAG TPA: 50S ribosomal protein L9 [Anaerohalosphaeraceae bacterium]|nr:50S ribosomal protein L9 [Anaerohalosphaeraceae bacterium]HQG06282.1 50S ribosomal protein L9 [Anaerohalosphaeraceae bacterium]HQI07659.1 50S ribosomal protein L9 [Anaerohalosphaeraceae bacterium]HQJ67876.1 50S ribosomal protein L9 [Anaerohalosphaeraceae bacterium]
MKVLLCEDVAKLGWLGDVVEVKDGYARNYLLPQGLAVIPTEAAVRSLAEEKAKRAEARRMAREEKERLSVSLEGVEIQLSARANELGHLFGSVTESDIAEALQKKGFAVTADMVQMEAHIKEVGSRTVIIKAASDLRAAVLVIVAAEEQTVGADEETSSH